MTPIIKATIKYMGVTYQVSDIMLNRQGKIIRVDTMPADSGAPFYTFREEALREAEVTITLEDA